VASWRRTSWLTSSISCSILAREPKWRREEAAHTSSPKVIIGLSILGFFALLTIFGPYLAPFNPNKPRSRRTSRHRCTTFLATSLGQDIFSQTARRRPATMVVALVAGLVATMLSMIIAISAGYLGGFSDDGLSLLSNVFLACRASAPHRYRQLLTGE